MKHYSLGQTLPSAHVPAIFRHGESRWHILLSMPAKERKAIQWLSDRFSGHDVKVFTPMEEARVWRRGRPVMQDRKILPGYVFTEFPGDPIWHEVFECPFVHDCVRTWDNNPGVLKSDGAMLVRLLGSLIAAEQRKTEEFNRKRRRAMTLRKGDRAIVRAGVHNGAEIEVKALRGAGGAVFEMEFFGSVRDVEIPAEDLERVIPDAEIAQMRGEK